ncbi:ABC transporter ATP-binding protein [bacterium]|nr:MAG: ABC transporter ATP-binding protein [bacterium]
MSIITTHELSKNFGTFTAVDSLSVHIREGEIYGFLGLNGAGKTTLIRMLLGMIKPSSGLVQLFGRPLNASFDGWNEIGYLIETPHNYPNLTVKENLQVIAKLRKIASKQIDEVIERLHLSSYTHSKAEVLSLGNQQRLGLAKAMIHKPKLLILDEPINGLDPAGIVEIRTLLQELAQQGSTIFLSSHILSEIAKLANRIGIIHQGKLIHELTQSDLHHQLHQSVIIDTSEAQASLKHLSAEFSDISIYDSGEIHIQDARAVAHPEIINSDLVKQGIPLRQIRVFTEDLEHFFLRTIETKATV